MHCKQGAMDIISNNSHGHTNSFHRIKILINLTKHEGSAICEDVPPHSLLVLPDCEKIEVI